MDMYITFSILTFILSIILLINYITIFQKCNTQKIIKEEPVTVSYLEYQFNPHNFPSDIHKKMFQGANIYHGGYILQGGTSKMLLKEAAKKNIKQLTSM